MRLAVLSALVAASVASAKDAKGCRDLDLVPRMPGAEITRCEAYYYNEDDIFQKDEKRVAVAGDYQKVEYKQAEGWTAETIKNYENALVKVGYVLQADVHHNASSRTDSFLYDKEGKKIWLQVAVWDDGKGYRLIQLSEQAPPVRIKNDLAPPVG